MAMRRCVPGDFTIADNATGNGRQITLDAKSIASADATGTATHWALVVTGSGILRRANALSGSVSVTSGNPVNVSSFVVDRMPFASA